jgi:hypothetical protein
LKIRIADEYEALCSDQEMKIRAGVIAGIDAGGKGGGTEDDCRHENRKPLHPTFSGAVIRGIPGDRGRRDAIVKGVFLIS